MRNRNNKLKPKLWFEPRRRGREDVGKRNKTNGKTTYGVRSKIHGKTIDGVTGKRAKCDGDEQRAETNGKTMDGTCKTINECAQECMYRCYTKCCFQCEVLANTTPPPLTPGCGLELGSTRAHHTRRRRNPRERTRNHSSLYNSHINVYRCQVYVIKVDKNDIHCGKVSRARMRL